MIGMERKDDDASLAKVEVGARKYWHVHQLTQKMHGIYGISTIDKSCRVVYISVRYLTMSASPAPESDGVSPWVSSLASNHVQ